MSSPIITMYHIRQAGYCARGVRDFFMKHDLDYADFIANGISADLLLQASNNDWMVQKVVEIARGQG